MGGTIFDLIENTSKKILNLRQSLVPFLMFMEDREIEFYADLEEILIFENISDFGIEPSVIYLFLDDLKYIIDIYNKVQKIVGAHQISVKYERENSVGRGYSVRAR